MMAKEILAVKTTGHAAAVRKIRCPKCKLGYAVGDARTGYKCGQCGAQFKQQKL